ncbi:MAG: YmdB family metallophosphoesterase [Treponema sp.]|nr:YmdB family metallophosphoesterase [Treponema sp.]
MQTLRAIMLGDVVGDPGLDVLERLLPAAIKEHSADFVMVNGENAAAGFGLTLPHLERLFAAGADLVSGGNHIWEKRDFWPVLDTEKRLLRPMNYAPGSPGKGWVKLDKPSPWGGPPITWAVLNLQGREFMSPLDCPFRAFDAFEGALWPSHTKVHPTMDSQGNLPDYMREKPVILVDFHAESSREKEALAYYLDGRASAVVGTHTHVQTADERILPKGTAYITDLGMCGVLDGVIGMDTRICVDRARNQVLYRMEVAAPAEGDKIGIQGIVVEFDGESRKALSIKRLA